MVGIKPSDLDRYKVCEQCRLPVVEKGTGEDLLKEALSIRVDELIQRKRKAEI